MSRPTRVPYHQNVYDLLELPPGECPDARRLIAAHEAAHGPLPASVREWYLVPNVVPLSADPARPWWGQADGSLWYRFSNMDPPRSLEQVLAEFDGSRHVAVLTENQGNFVCRVEVDGSDDPPVALDNSPLRAPLTDFVPVGQFSRFIWNWVRYFHACRNHPEGWDSVQPTNDPHAAGVWACSPAAPFRPAVLDLLFDRMDADPPQLLADGVVRHRFRADAGAIRVTADHSDWPSPHAAWWAEAEDADHLAELLAPLRPWGVLGDDARRPVADPVNADPFADA
jgi:hypothetical protein